MEEFYSLFLYNPYVAAIVAEYEPATAVKFPVISRYVSWKPAMNQVITQLWVGFKEFEFKKGPCQIFNNFMFYLFLEIKTRENAESVRKFILQKSFPADERHAFDTFKLLSTFATRRNKVLQNYFESYVHQ